MQGDPCHKNMENNGRRRMALTYRVVFENTTALLLFPKTYFFRIFREYLKNKPDYVKETVGKIEKSNKKTFAKNVTKRCQ